MSRQTISSKGLEAIRLHIAGAVPYPERASRDTYAAYLLQTKGMNNYISYEEFKQLEGEK